jgi:FlaA1/EpsC-like NDP-sugar epimerase
MDEQRILIIGGTGSLGRNLIRKLIDNNNICIFSRDEAKQWTLRNEYKGTPNLFFKIGDIRDRQRVQEVMNNFKPSIVIIAAALKHVDTCELTPMESIKTNILGIQNVIDSINGVGVGSSRQEQQVCGCPIWKCIRVQRQHHSFVQIPGYSCRRVYSYES